jgi:hypothetical protein
MTVPKHTLLAGGTIIALVCLWSFGKWWLPQTQSVQVQAQENTSAGAPLLANLNRILRVNVPSTFRELVTMLALEVEGESIFGGEVEFQNDVVFDGQITLNGNAFGDGVSINLGSGEITASNIMYSLEAGSGISISEGQNPTISVTDLGSAQNIFKKVKVGSDTAESDENSDTLEFAAGSGISVSVDTGSDRITISNSTLPGFIKSGTYAVLADGITSVGVGTATPSNVFEVNSGVADTSGFSFTQLTSSSTAGVGGGKVLSVDSGGRIILVADQTGDTPTAESVLPSATNGMTLYFNGTNWAASDNLFHDGGSIGISNAAPTSRLHVNTNLASKIGLIVQGYTSQTANLQEWRDSSGSTLSYIDANGVFNGQANVSGSLNPGLTNGSVLFQGSSGITQDNTNFFWDDTNNRLGIGTNSPGANLHISSSTGTNLLRLSNSTTGLHFNFSVGTTGLAIGGTNNSFVINNDAATGSLTLTSSQVVVGSGMPIIGNGATTDLTLRSNTTGSVGYGVAIQGYNGSTWQTVLRAPNKSSGNIDLHLVSNGGNVGIGTSSPASLLNISSSTATQLLVDTTSTTADAKLGFRRTGIAEWQMGRRGSDGSFRIGQSNDLDQLNALTILTSGNVGIGDTNPTARLAIGNDSTYNGTLWVGAIGTNPNRLANFGSVFEVTTGAGPNWTGQGVRVDGTNRAFQLVGSATNITDNTVFSIDVGGASSLFNNPTSGNKTLITTGTNATFMPTSGTATYTALDIRSTVNQTGGANGVTRGLYINPTLTAAADWRSIDIANNSGYGIYQSGASANNYFAGRVGIGATAPSALLDIPGVSTTNIGIGNDGRKKTLAASVSSPNDILSITSNGATGGWRGTINMDVSYNASTAFTGMTIRANTDGTTANVGIGTTAPASKLHIGGVTTATSGLTISNATTNVGYVGVDNTNELAVRSDQGIFFQTGGSSNRMRILSNGLVSIGTNSALATLGIRNVSAATIPMLIQNSSGTEILRVTEAGNVGIGTTNPGAALEVNGDIWANSGANRLTSAGLSRIGGANHYVAPSGGDLEVGSTGNLNLETNGGTVRAMTLDTAGNVGINTLSFGTNAARVLAIAGSTAPTTSITDGIQLFAVDVAGSHELQVRDEAANVTTLSPHNFSVIGERSEELAWSFYSERNSLAINADMTKALRVVEKLSGEKLIYLKDLATGQMLEDESVATQLTELADNGSIGQVAKWNYQLWTFVGEVIFEKPVQFLAEVTVKGKAVFAAPTWFGGRTTFADQDMGGFATIAPGAQEVSITFTTPFSEKPVITVSPEGKVVEYSLQAASSTGFTIRLTQPTAEQVTFNWVALMIDQAQTTSSQPAAVAPAATPEPPEVINPEPTPTVSSPLPQASPTLEPSPSPTVAPSPSILPQPSASPEGTESATLNQ